ncbi:MAG: hypothetical protein IKO27_06725, partial [Ruminococcus sp.]|nr:hypothetical protein [Ruminococcus sp.]
LLELCSSAQSKAADSSGKIGSSWSLAAADRVKAAGTSGKIGGAADIGVPNSSPADVLGGSLRRSDPLSL